ncbi:MAG: hypothetical protein Q8907_04990 [Bacteroidota bacterium]|nr:hypothetical protein [Bacteroidota bacterium]MDP4225133.1 hypothetical protein [Bacteroidota bacterium]MDP4273618.1 hypothetical protein [Bacteroidota bacterium]
MKKFFLIFCLLFTALIFSASINGQGQKGTKKLYYRHLKLNHMSPYFDYIGHYPLTAQEAKKVNHYCFTYYKNKLVSIEEKGTDYCWAIHPLLFMGAEKVCYTYTPGKRTARYFNAKGEPSPNYKGVYVEETTFNKRGQKVSLKYYDYKGKPMQGVWNVAEYNWDYRDSLVIEHRKNVKGDWVDVSPYFPFRVSGFKVDPVKHTIAHYNLDENYKIINSPQGIACYKDQENAQGDQLNWKYYDSKGTLISPYGYSEGENIFDHQGYIVKMNFYVGNNVVGTRSFQYNKEGAVKTSTNVWNGVKQISSSEANIHGFTIKNQKSSSIDTLQHTIKITVPKGTDLSFIVPVISVPMGAVIHPAPNVPVDFSKGCVRYTVIAANIVHSQDWMVTVNAL